MNAQGNPILDKIIKLSEGPRKIISSAVNFILSGKQQKMLGELRSIALRIDSKKEEMHTLSDTELKSRTELLRQRLENGETLDQILVDAFATIREAARRVLKEEHYLVQIMGGIAMHRGMIAEMKTGEGKTLSALLPAYLNALPGKGVHIITTNDYLAKRDAEWMGQVFQFLGLSVGYVISQMPQSQKRDAYFSDVTYCTNSELGFDFLRDNMAYDESECCQRELNYCIVDEADSVLIDEAKTPLIISGPTTNIVGEYMKANSIITKLKPEHYEINLKEHQAHFTNEGLEEIARIFREDGTLSEEESLYSQGNSVLLHQLTQALKANHLFRLGVDYLIKSENDGFGGNPRPSVKLIDTNTGRVLEGRRYSDGLHQALEAKESVPIRGESETLSSITFQQLFRLYKKLSGMTGTALTESEEFETTYGLRCLSIPTNLPKLRVDQDDVIYLRKMDKMRAIIEQVSTCHQKGQPIIIGTTSVESSEEIADYLSNAGFDINVLNAKNHTKEADIIANAGRLGAITVVTNMAGRGTDIKLGGDAKVIIRRRTYGWENEEQIKAEAELVKEEVQKNKEAVMKAGGLFILGADHNNSRRIDDQLRGRAGRQGDPGESRFFESTDGDLFRKFNPNMTNMLIQFGAKEDEVLEHPWLTGAISNAQQRMEAYNFESRQSMQKYSDIKEFYMMRFLKHRRKILESKNINQIIIHNFEQVLNSLEYLTQLANVCGYSDESGELKDWARELFYASISHYKEEYKEDANKRLRRCILYSIDDNIKNYMLIMSNERDVVALHSYSQKDPIMAYYRIAREKYDLVNKRIVVDSVINVILQARSDERYDLDEDDIFQALEDVKKRLQQLDSEEQSSKETSDLESIKQIEDQIEQAENTLEIKIDETPEVVENGITKEPEEVKTEEKVVVEVK
jgi:preprotein translocase subunit SecA